MLGRLERAENARAEVPGHQGGAFADCVEKLKWENECARNFFGKVRSFGKLPADDNAGIEHPIGGWGTHAVNLDFRQMMRAGRPRRSGKIIPFRRSRAPRFGKRSSRGTVQIVVTGLLAGTLLGLGFTRFWDRLPYTVAEIGGFLRVLSSL